MFVNAVLFYTHLLFVLLAGTSASFALFFLELAMIGLGSATMILVVVYGIVPIIVAGGRLSKTLANIFWPWFIAKFWAALGLLYLLIMMPALDELVPFYHQRLVPLGHTLLGLLFQAGRGLRWLLTQFIKGLWWLGRWTWKGLVWVYRHILTPIGHGLAWVGEDLDWIMTTLWDWMYPELYELWVDFNLDVLDPLCTNVRESWQWFVPKFWARLGWTYLFILMPLGQAGLWIYCWILKPVGYVLGNLLWGMGSELVWAVTQVGRGLWWLLVTLIGKPINRFYLQAYPEEENRFLYGLRKIWIPWITLWAILHLYYQITSAALLCLGTGALIHFVFDFLIWNPEMHQPKEKTAH